MSGKPHAADPSVVESSNRPAPAPSGSDGHPRPEEEPVAAELAHGRAAQHDAATSARQSTPSDSPERPVNHSPGIDASSRPGDARRAAITATLPATPPARGVAAAPEEAPRGWRKNWLLWLPLSLVLVIAVVAGPAIWLTGGLHRMVGVWYIVQAEQRYEADDLEEASRLLDRAVAWLPGDPLAYDHRGQVRLERNNLQGALADFSRVIELNPHYYGGYAGRSAVLQRLGRFREAIDDCNRAIKLRPESDPAPWNNRAYARALGNMELEAALADIEHAIELSGEEVPAYLLDTRGYVLYRLGQHEAALRDLNRAAELAQSAHDQLQRGGEKPNRPAGERRRRQRLAREELAVILHHRGLVHRALGNTSQANDDLQRAEELGYDPKRGAY